MATKEIQPPPTRTKTQAPRENMVTKAWDETVKYLKGVKSELKRVTWPTPQELRYNTIIVIFVVTGIAFYMWLVDKGLNFIFHALHRA